jgi:alpha,alpha-trehalase
MADDADYYIKIIQWFLAHPEKADSFLVKLPEHASAEEIAQRSCDPQNSKACAAAHVGQWWLSPGFYDGDRADRESGFDVTFRFGPYSGDTQNYAPLCLNSLLVRYARDMAELAIQLGRNAEARDWKRRGACARRRHQQVSMEPEAWPLFRLRFCPSPAIDLRIPDHFLSSLGGSCDTGAGSRCGSQHHSV